MDSACATLESPLDSSKHIIAQLLCPVQHSLMQGFLLSASLLPVTRSIGILGRAQNKKRGMQRCDAIVAIPFRTPAVKRCRNKRIRSSKL